MNTTPFSVAAPQPATFPAVSRADGGVIGHVRLRFARNVRRFPFPCAIKTEDAETLWRETSAALDGMGIFRGGLTAYMPRMKRFEKIYLVERRVLSPDMLKNELPSGAVFSADERICVLVNEEDHFRISVTVDGLGAASSAAETLTAVDGFLAERFEYAGKSGYGYLTSCPSNLGSGLRISALFHLGACVIDRLADELLDSAERAGYYVRGYYGEKSRYYGDVYQISTASPPELSEIGAVTAFFRSLAAREISARESIVSAAKKGRTADMVWRAWGLLTSARMMSFAEAMSLLSMAMLGKDIGIPLPAGGEVLARLAAECQPAHMQAAAGCRMSAAQRDEYRADHIRRALS